MDQWQHQIIQLFIYQISEINDLKTNFHYHVISVSHLSRVKTN